MSSQSSHSTFEYLFDRGEWVLTSDSVAPSLLQVRGIATWTRFHSLHDFSTGCLIAAMQFIEVVLVLLAGFAMVLRFVALKAPFHLTVAACQDPSCYLGIVKLLVLAGDRRTGT